MAWLASLVWDTCNLLLAAATFVAIAALWVLALWGIVVLFKSWRMYSRHWLAVKLRRAQNARKAARRAS